MLTLSSASPQVLTTNFQLGRGSTGASRSAGCNPQQFICPITSRSKRGGCRLRPDPRPVTVFRLTADPATLLAGGAPTFFYASFNCSNTASFVGGGASTGEMMGGEVETDNQYFHSSAQSAHFLTAGPPFNRQRESKDTTQPEILRPAWVSEQPT